MTYCDPSSWFYELMQHPIVWHQLYMAFTIFHSFYVLLLTQTSCWLGKMMWKFHWAGVLLPCSLIKVANIPYAPTPYTMLQCRAEETRFYFIYFDMIFLATKLDGIQFHMISVRTPHCSQWNVSRFLWTSACSFLLIRKLQQLTAVGQHKCLMT